MLKHMEDGGEFNMLIDDAGNLLVLCSKCKKVWTGRLAFAESPTSAKQAKTMVNAALRKSPSLLRGFGIDAKLISALKLQ